MPNTMGGDMASQPHPICYFWIAHYNDGTCLPQYDPNDYHANKITDIDQSKLVKVGWYPLSPLAAEELNKRGIPDVSNPFLPKVEVEITDKKRFILFTRNFIANEEYRICQSCGNEFAVNQDTKIFDNTKYPSPICPYCGAHDYFVCKDCGEKFERFEDTENTPPEKGGPGHCPKCGGHLKRVRVTTVQYSRERRWRLYAVGYQETINDRNYKTILYVSENGDVTVKYE